MPAACDSTRLRCKVARSAAAMRTVASLPNPVLMPYTGSPRATILATVWDPAATAARQFGSNVAAAPR